MTSTAILPPPLAPVRPALRCAALLLAVSLFTGSGAALAQDGGGLLHGAAGFAEEYLADKRRAGALVGGLLGSALTAHPAGSIVGSILGFWIGKATMYEDPRLKAEAEADTAFLDPRRPIVPDAGGTVASLSFSSGEATTLAPLAPAAGSIAAVPAPGVLSSAAAAPAPSGGSLLAMPTVAILPGGAPASPLAPLAGHLPIPPDRDQLAMLCSNGASSSRDHRLRKACFYFQGY